MPAAVAVVASAAISAASSKSASKSAAKGQGKGLAASKEMSGQAIRQAKDYFNIGQLSSQAGFKSALDFFKNTQPAKYEPMIQGNVAAQRVIGQGAQQANNAILGLPVDMSFTNQQTAIQPNYSAVQSAQIPVSFSQQTTIDPNYYALQSSQLPSFGGQQMGPQQTSVSQTVARESDKARQQSVSRYMLGAQ